MKKYAKLLSLAVALCLVLGLASTAYASMPDVNSHWAQASVEKWVDSGLAKGYPDGTFKPDNNITRAEFVALLNRAFTVQGNSAGAAFADVAEGDWYYTDVCAATSAGYVKGYEDNTFGPNKAITRAEAAAIVSRLLGITADDDSVLDKFSDAAAISDWAKADVAAMVEANLLSGYPDGTFGPARLITRAESIVTLDRSMGYKAEEVPVTGVKLDVSNFTLKVDGTKQLEATVMPANASLKAVTWKSGNEKVATVDDNGKVKAIGTGNTTITVTTLDGNKTATCNVAVIRTSGGGGSSGPVTPDPTFAKIVAADVAMKDGLSGISMGVKVDFPKGVTNVKVTKVDDIVLDPPKVLTDGVFANVPGKYTDGANAVTFVFESDNSKVYQVKVTGNTATSPVEVGVVPDPVMPTIKATDVATKDGLSGISMGVKVDFPAGVTNVKVTKVDDIVLDPPKVLTDGVFANVPGKYTDGANAVTFVFESDNSKVYQVKVTGNTATSPVEVGVSPDPVVPTIKATDVTTKNGLPGISMGVMVDFPKGVTNVKVTKVDDIVIDPPKVLASGKYANVPGKYAEGANVIVLTFDANGEAGTVTVTR